MVKRLVCVYVMVAILLVFSVACGGKITETATLTETTTLPPTTITTTVTNFERITTTTTATNTVTSTVTSTETVTVTTTPTPNSLPLEVTEYSFTPTSIAAGGTSTFTITVTNGAPGNYALRIMWYTATAADTMAGEVSFFHNGISTTATIPLIYDTPGTYYMELPISDVSTWLQPNDSSRLTVTPVS